MNRIVKSFISFALDLPDITHELLYKNIILPSCLKLEDHINIMVKFHHSESIHILQVHLVDV